MKMIIIKETWGEVNKWHPHMPGYSGAKQPDFCPAMPPSPGSENVEEKSKPQKQSLDWILLFIDYTLSTSKESRFLHSDKSWGQFTDFQWATPGTFAKPLPPPQDAGSLIINGDVGANPIGDDFFPVCHINGIIKGLKPGPLLPITSGKRIPESMPGGHLNYTRH